MSRTIQRLRHHWKFTRTRQEDASALDCDDTAWESVQVPHDWAIAGPFDPTIDQREANGWMADVESGITHITGRTGALPHVGEGWYRIWVDVPAADSPKRYRLECDGIMSRPVIHCNGQLAGTWGYGYTSFALDLTEFIKPGEANLISVACSNLEESARWYPGAGIYRNIRLVELDPTHIDHWGVEITTPEVEDSRGTVRIKTRIVDAQQHTTLRTTLLDPAGKTLVSEECAASECCDQTLTVDTPQRWSLETPLQYTVRSEVMMESRLTDTLDTRFGFRTLRFDANHGFFLNETPLTFKGVCIHHDLGPLGAAVNVAALRRQLDLLKEMGVNAIRTSHNPPAPELPMLASEMGILIIDEMFDEWKYPKCDNGYNTLWDEWAEKDARALIKRDRNHPAVIMWSLGNEIPEQGKEDGGDICRFLHEISHDEDPTRPTTAGFNDPKGAIRNGLAEVVDLPGWNYLAHLYGTYHQTLPHKPTYGSETESTYSSRGIYRFPVRDERNEKHEDLQVSDYGMSYPSWGYSPDMEFRAQEECSFVMGEFAWTGFDYLGEPSPYMLEWPSRSSYHGIIDLGGLPKSRYYLYQSTWTDKVVLHVLPHWTWPGREGERTPVHCFTSYRKAELFLNGRSLGVRHKHAKDLGPGRYRLVWEDVYFEPGELKVVAFDQEDTPGTETVIRTAGEPSAIELEVDRSSIQADGEDMAFVTVRIVDKDGTLCPHADTQVTYSIEGPAELVGLCNGDPSSVQSFKGSEMKVFSGMAVAYVQSMEGSVGPITLHAHATGLQGASVTIDSV